MNLADSILDWLMEKCMTWFLLALIAAGVALVIWFIIMLGHDYYITKTEVDVESGIIVEKSHCPAYTSMIMSGKVLVPIFHPEAWTLTISGRRAKSGRMDTVEFEVKERMWENLKEGDRFP